jgi:hypothetical protein
MDSIIILLLTLDIAIQVLIWLHDEMKPKPMTFLEYFNFTYDEKQNLLRILERENDETRKLLQNNYLNIRDQMRKDNEKNS